MSNLILPARSIDMSARTDLEKSLLQQVEQLERNQKIGLKYMNFLQALLFETFAILEEVKAEVVLSQPLLDFYTKNKENVEKARNARKHMLENLSSGGSATGDRVGDGESKVPVDQPEPTLIQVSH